MQIRVISSQNMAENFTFFAKDHMVDFGPEVTQSIYVTGPTLSIIGV